ncbi:MAG TPA: hypothetical protein VM492_11100 [Sumerlaeia bacterium]|nr:hypothetical protein [Sumerlaeia bacterium]
MASADASPAKAPDRKPPPLSLKPDFDETARRWDAYWQGEIIDRPVIAVTAPVEGFEPRPVNGYRERLHGDIDELIDKTLHNASGAIYGGESLPQFWTSFGPDEIGVFCGAEFVWSGEIAGDTNWCTRIVDDWEEALPLRLVDDNPTWLRMQEIYRKAEPRLRGHALTMPIDSHSNMDLLQSLRGSQQLCLDMLERPELIDRAMADARAIFPKMLNALNEIAKWDEHGWVYHGFSMDRCYVLACDFICLMSPPQFRRWVLPALEEEAELIRHAVFHWDGPGALVHADDLLASKGLHTFAYVPEPGAGHMDYLDLYKEVQARGKAVSVGGSADEIKAMHRELDPAKTVYHTGVKSPKEIDDLLAWFRNHT